MKTEYIRLFCDKTGINTTYHTHITKSGEYISDLFKPLMTFMRSADLSGALKFITETVDQVRSDTRIEFELLEMRRFEGEASVAVVFKVESLDHEP
jgi:hypothetical protein